MNHSISSVVFIETKPNGAQQQIEAFSRLQPLVLAEKGCLQYELTQVVGEENHFVLLEKWASQADLDAHNIAPHMLEADEKNKAFRAKPAMVYVMKSV